MKIREFLPSSWAIDNRSAIYLLTVMITLGGVMAYIGLPKEQFPEVVFPQILVTTVYPGTGPSDMENLVTRPIEKQVKSIVGVKKIKSNSIQDFSIVTVEFGTDADVAQAKQKVKDAVDRARAELPRELPQDPTVTDVDISQIPICVINLSGDYDLTRLKVFAEQLKDKVEGLKEITRVDMVGALDREIRVNVDLYKMQGAALTMRDIENAIGYENLNVSGGSLTFDNMKRNVSIRGEFRHPRELENIVVRGNNGATLLLKDVADIEDGYEEQLSYSRLNKKNVISLNVIKRSGENLIEAVDQIKGIIAEMQASTFPDGLKVTLTADQSRATRITLNDLINTIIIGFILVTLVLMFFMGTVNAMFVGLSVPISMCIAFLVMPTIGFTLNFVVLFGFLLALGIVVDDAIVVIENTHRIFDNGRIPIRQAAKQAAGEVFIPVFSGTLTTLAPFFPLAFWQGVIGKFMFYMPVTLIVTLTASLLVAYIVNPVFAVDFMKPHGIAGGDMTGRRVRYRLPVSRSFWVTTIFLAVIALLAHMAGNRFLGNLAIFVYLFYLLNKFVLNRLIRAFQERFWPRVLNGYARFLSRVLTGWRKPALVFVSTFGLFVLSLFLFASIGPKVVFFPESDPNFIYTYVELPIGTHQRHTDSIVRIVENRIIDKLGADNPLVESVISNVAVGAGNQTDFEVTETPHKGKVSVGFVEFEARNGVSTKPYLNKIREAVKGIPGAIITVEQEVAGPPVSKPINIEISSDDLPQLIVTSQMLRRYLDSLNIAGVEELKTDLALNLPEVVVNIDRLRAGREGISTGQIGSDIRKMVFGQDRPSKLRDEREEYPIQVRLKESQRSDLGSVLSQTIIYRDMAAGGMLRQVPLSAFADAEYTSSYAGIRRKNNKRVVTISSNVIDGYNPMEVVAQVQRAAAGFKLPQGVSIDFTGEQEEQMETISFLGKSLLISVLLIILILMIQFNSISRTVIILSEIIFSVTGVLLGFTLTGWEFSSVMGGIGIVALAGIVVRNGILMVEFADQRLSEGADLKTALVDAGKTRMTPVLMTAISTILGLVPLAIGFNIDFYRLFAELNPHIFFGGDSVAFWGPLSWSIIFGLAFATLLTLIVVPVMLLLAGKLKQALGLPVQKKKVKEIETLVVAD